MCLNEQSAARLPGIRICWSPFQAL